MTEHGKCGAKGSTQGSRRVLICARDAGHPDEHEDASGYTFIFDFGTVGGGRNSAA